MSNAARWTMVDAIGRPSNLSEDDQCIYLHVYTPGKGFSYSYANQLVYNYKIKPSEIRSNPRREYHKKKAINEYITELVCLFGRLNTDGGRIRMVDMGAAVALVPIPPSVPLGDENYDDRNARTCEAVCMEYGFTYCRDIEARSYIGSSHQGGSRNPEAIRSTLTRSSLGANRSTYVFLIDDTLVSGAHFVACKDFLRGTGCNANVCGIFLARSIRE